MILILQFPGETMANKEPVWDIEDQESDTLEIEVINPNETDETVTVEATAVLLGEGTEDVSESEPIESLEEILVELQSDYLVQDWKDIDVRFQ